MSEFKRCVFFLLDGARSDVMDELVKKGDLPNISRHLMERGGFRRAVSVFPSTTGPAFVPFLTGCFPGTCDLPGIRWLDRKKFGDGRFSLKKHRSYVGLESYLFNRDMPKDIKTLFELSERPVNIFSSVNRGSTFRGNRTKFSRIFYWSYAQMSHSWEVVDMKAARHLSVALEWNPDFVFALFPGVDVISHRTDPFSTRTLDEYRRIDGYIGMILNKLRRLGMYEETLLVLSSDHGLTATHTHFGLVEFLEEKGIKTFHHPRIMRNGCSAAVMVSGNGMANVYRRSPDGWSRRTTYEELRTDRIDFIYELATRKEIDFVASLGENGDIIVTSERGEARIGRANGNGTFYYDVKGLDPFYFDELPQKINSKISIESTYESEFPDAIMQLVQLFRSERTGDIVVSARKGYDLRLKYEIPEHRSTHGAMCREHMLVPLFFSYPIKKDKIRTVDVFPSIIKLLGKRNENEIDGMSFD